MNNFPSCLRRGRSLHQMVQGQGVVNPRILDHRRDRSLARGLLLASIVYLPLTFGLMVFGKALL